MLPLLVPASNAFVAPAYIMGDVTPYGFNIEYEAWELWPLLGS